MLLVHAIAIAEARSYLAALADQATTLQATIAYDDALLYLDAVHGDRVPALDELPTIEPALLLELTEKSLVDLVAHGFDPLHVELLLAMIDDARDQEPPTQAPERDQS